MSAPQDPLREAYLQVKDQPLNPKRMCRRGCIEYPDGKWTLCAWHEEKAQWAARETHQHDPATCSQCAALPPRQDEPGLREALERIARKYEDEFTIEAGLACHREMHAVLAALPAEPQPPIDAERLRRIEAAAREEMRTRDVAREIAGRHAEAGHAYTDTMPDLEAATIMATDAEEVLRTALGSPR